MPIGILANSSCVLIGGLLGAWLGRRMKETLVQSLFWTMGITSLMLGTLLVSPVKNFAAVAIALILGTLIGEILRLESRLENLAVFARRKLPGVPQGMTPEAEAQLVSALVLFCASGTGIFGALNEGLSGDPSILLLKSILDFFTAMILAAKLGPLIGYMALPQILIYLVLFLSADLISRVLSPATIVDFRACGGVITFSIGLKVLEIKPVRVASMLPALILVVPASGLWQLLF